MLKEAEQFAEEDKIAKERIDAKNSLDSYIYSVKNQIDDEVRIEFTKEKTRQAPYWGAEGIIKRFGEEVRRMAQQDWC